MGDEWIIPSSEEPLRQGDLLLSRDPFGKLPQTLSLVMTADCDISHNKHGRNLACLRVISFSEYIRKIFASRKLQKTIASETKKIQDQFNKWNSIRIGETSNISSDAVTTWVRHSTPEQITKELQVTEPESKKVISSISGFRNGILSRDAHAQYDEFTQLTIFKSSLLNQSPKQVKSEIIKQAKSEKTT